MEATRKQTIEATGIIRFSNAIDFDTNGLTSSLSSRLDDQINNEYAVITDTYAINQSGHRIPIENLKKECTRFSFFDKNELQIVKRIDSIIDTLLLHYIKEYPMSLPCLWWKTEGHVLYYREQNELGLHSDNDINFRPGLVPDFQLGTRHILAAIAYFHVDCEGGELVFPYLNKKIKPESGDIIFFPSNFIYSHQVQKIHSGTRLALLSYYGQGTDNQITPITIRNSSDEIHGGQVWMDKLFSNYETYISNIDTPIDGNYLLPLTRERDSAGTFDEIRSKTK